MSPSLQPALRSHWDRSFSATIISDSLGGVPIADSLDSLLTDPQDPPVTDSQKLTESAISSAMPPELRNGDDEKLINSALALLVLIILSMFSLVVMLILSLQLLVLLEGFIAGKTGHVL